MTSRICAAAVFALLIVTTPARASTVEFINLNFGGGYTASGSISFREVTLAEFQRREAASMLDAGKARSEIAALLGVHVGTLRRALKGPDDLGGSVRAREKFPAPVRAKKRA